MVPTPKRSRAKYPTHMPTPKLTAEILNAAMEGFESQKRRIDSQIDALRQLLSAGRTEGVPSSGARTLKRKTRAAGRRRVAAAQKAGWAKLRGKSVLPSSPVTANSQNESGNSVRLAERYSARVPPRALGVEKGPKLRNYNKPAPIEDSSEEIVGGFGLRAACQVSDSERVRGHGRCGSVGFSGSHFGFVVQSLNDGAGKELLGSKVVEGQLTVLTERPGDLFYGFDAGTHCLPGYLVA
jgi:hypothetical protein